MLLIGILFYWGWQTFQNQLPAATPIPSTAQTTLAPGSLIFQDAFDTNTNGWDIGDYSGTLVVGKQTITNGKLRWEAKALDSMLWYKLPALAAISDFHASVDVQQMSGIRNAETGIVFRYVDPDNYYVFEISENKFGLFEKYTGSWKTLMSWESTSAIQLNASNRLAVQAQGSRITLLINGIQIAATDDNQFSKGKVGLAIGLENAGDQAVFEFDNLAVRTPLAINTPVPTLRATPKSTSAIATTPPRSALATITPLPTLEPVKITNAAANWSPSMGNGNWYYVEGNPGDYANWQDLRFDPSLRYLYCNGGCWRSNAEGDFVRLDQFGGHPGQSHYVGKRWVSPIAGSIHGLIVTRMVESGGNGVTLRLIQNGNVLQTVSIGGDQTQDLPITFDTSITIKGWLMMAVESNGDTNHDHTVFDMTIWKNP